jgi:hypothetical protein
MNTTTTKLPRKSATAATLTSVYRSLYRSHRHRRTITPAQKDKNAAPVADFRGSSVFDTGGGNAPYHLYRS